ncbi:MAG: polysulfide reductase NrfD [Rubrobacteraceae bacterium]|uniref:NrfD/PsrC family molybdoenzyme membrane anchor subunit n=1 Tax=Rubrobacter naiadicus TaxID=1392641 RepID=UPI002360FF0C|nr:NrfD/PsrC family molybdoenzyme membrane anchor subunit [Rubrobacter naiadicus]MBX6762934.1 polysulfide reductase NrfD [Rubrobacteraceae bacterium]
MSEERNGRRTDSYYGRPVIKEPVWTWEIPWYFFTGGLAGASAPLALAADLSGNQRLARSARLAALGGAMVSPVLLISDLGRPERFLNMLRVVKPTSPMSIGTWVLSSFGLSSGIAATSDVFGVFPRARTLFEGAAALLGLPLATYTAVLFADTSVPVWHEARKELPLVFASGAAASAGACAAVFTPVGEAAPARRLAVGGVLAEIGAAELMKRRLGRLLAEPYEKEEAGRYSKLATTLSGAGAAVLGLAGGKNRAAAVAGGAMILAGALCERWSVYKAGFQSARDPRYTVEHQRERRRRKGL